MKELENSRLRMIASMILIAIAFIVAIVLLYHYGMQVSTQLHSDTSVSTNMANGTRLKNRLVQNTTNRSNAKSFHQSAVDIELDNRVRRASSKQKKLYESKYSENVTTTTTTTCKSFIKSFVDRPCSLEPILTLSGNRQRIAILVGINYVNDSRNHLMTCFRDIEGMAQWLLSTGAWSKSNMYVLTDVKTSSSVFDSSVARRPPTVAEMIKVWKHVHQRALQQPTEIVWMYSGHGTHKANTNDTELDGQDEYMVMTDGLIRDDDIYADFIRPLPSTCSVLAVMDACHSQTILDLPYSYNRLSQSAVQESKNVDTNSRMICISGCRDEQTSMAGASSRDFSALTKQVIQCLSSHINQPCTSWYDDLRQRFGRNQQIPMMTCSHTNVMHCILLGS
jgi:hypothetical protein